MTAYTWDGSFPSSPSTGDTLLINGTRHEYTAKGSWRKTEFVGQGTIETLAATLGKGNTVYTDGKINFRDAGLYISSSTDGQLDIVADTEIQIAATTVDINGAVALNGAITGATNITLSGELDAATGDFSGDVDVDGTLEADAITIAGTAIASVLSPIAGGTGIVTTGALDAGSITSNFGTIDNGASAITTTGVITGGTVEATTDTAAGDNAAMGYTSVDGLILTGQGSTNDVTIKNDSDATVMSIATGTTTATFAGTLSSGDITIAVDDTPTINFKKASTADVLSNINVTTDAGSGGKLEIQTKRNGNTALTALTLDDDQNATFAGDVLINGGNAAIGGVVAATTALTLYSTSGTHLRLNNSGELGFINVEADGELKVWAHGDNATDEVGIYTGSGSGTRAAAFGLNYINFDHNATFAGYVTQTKAGYLQYDMYNTDTGVAGSTRTMGITQIQGKSNTGVLRTFQSTTYNSADATNAGEDGGTIYRQQLAGTLSTWLTVDGITPTFAGNATFAGNVSVGDGTITPNGSIDNIAITSASAAAGITIGTSTSGVGYIAMADTDSNNGARQAYNHSTNAWSWTVGGADKFTLNASAATFTGNINAVAGGINLGATGAANLLNDYEEGTWTPAVNYVGGSPSTGYGAQVGSYVKVGKVVTATLYIVTNSHTAGSGSVKITGLPFTSAPSNIYIAGTIGYMQGLSASTTDTVIGYLPGNGTEIYIRKTNNSAVSEVVFTAATHFMYSITYKTT